MGPLGITTVAGKWANRAVSATGVGSSPAKKKAYTSGIDPQGKAYLWDATTNKMLYYGEPNQQWHNMGASLRNQGYSRSWEGDRSGGGATGVGGGGTGVGGGGYNTRGSSSPKLDQTQINSLLAQLGIYDIDRDNAKRQAATKRDTFRREKDEELKRERGKYDSKKQTVAQDYGTARTDTSMNARDTIQTLLSSLSTLGMGGSRELTRQILAAANKSNRQANTTQAQNNQELTSAFNEYKGGYENDLRKINDQYGADVALADKGWAENRRNTLHRVGDEYNKANNTAQRDSYMQQGNDLNSMIANSTFMNPSYTGESRAMATPELSDYSQDVAQFDTSAVGGEQANGANVPGNLGMKAVAINDKDFGIKKKNEANLGYGV